jgi:hypothetical protein
VVFPEYKNYGLPLSGHGGEHTLLNAYENLIVEVVVEKDGEETDFFYP